MKSTGTRDKESPSFRIFKAKQLYIPALLSLFLVLAVFFSTLKNDFNVDDHFLVKRNPIIQTLNPATHLTSPFWSRWDVSSQYYRPLVTWSLALDRAIHGEKAWGFHLTNILLHAINVFLFFLLLRQIGGELVGIMGAMLFAVHPVQVEPVVFVLGRTDLLCVLFLLLSAQLYARLWEPPLGRKGRLLFLSLITFSFALLCKELAVTFPALALAIDLARSRDKPWRSALPEGFRQFLRHFPFYLGMILGYLLIRYYVIGQFLGTPSTIEKTWQNPLFGASLGVRLLTAVNVAFRYFKLLIFPRHLSIDYGYDVVPLVSSIFSPIFLLSSLVILCFGAALLFLAWKKPVCLFGAVSLSGTYLLISHLFFPAPIIMAERFLYLPMIGLTVFLVSVVIIFAEAVAPLSRRTLVSIILVMLFLIPLSVRSIYRIRDWRNDLTLFSSAIKATPRSAMSWNNLGVEQKKRKDYEAAIFSFQRAIEIFPSFSRARVHLAASLRESGDLESAENILRDTIEDFPEQSYIKIDLFEVLTMRADRLSLEDREEEALALRREVVDRGQALLEDETIDMLLSTEANLMLTVAQNLVLLGENSKAEKTFEAALATAERELVKKEVPPDVAHTLKAGALGTFAWYLGKTDRHLEAAEKFSEARKEAQLAGKSIMAAQMEIDSGSEFLKADQLDAALDAFHKALILAVDDPEIKNKAQEALMTAAENALKTGRTKKALDIYDRLLGKEPKLVRARHGRARARMAANDLDGAEEDLIALIRTSQPPLLAAVIWNELAMISMQRNDLQEAKKRLDRSLEFDSGFAEALFRRGHLKAQLGESREAEKDLLAVLDLGIPQSAVAETWLQLAKIAYQQGDLVSAEERLRRCLAVQPKNAQAKALLQQIDR